MNERHVLISGCSGGGKSTLLAELAARGHPTVEEPGRRIVKRALATGDGALPWVDGVAFARQTLAMALADREAARDSVGWVFFDRGLIDAASALEDLTGAPARLSPATAQRYHRKVFVAPPWPQIYRTDPERRHGFEAGLAEYGRLERLLPALGYEVVLLPKVSVRERADFVMATLSQP